MDNSKSTILFSKIIEKIEIILGSCGFGLFLLCALVAMFDNEKDGAGVIIVMWIFALLGLWALMRGIKRRNMHIEFKKYEAILAVDSMQTINDLAATTGTTADQVKKNLQYMIKKKFFQNAYIDEQTNQLLFSSMKRNAAPSQYKYNENRQPMNRVRENRQQTKIIYVTYTCPHCGGINKVEKGKQAICDYCGSYISEDEI